MQDLARYFTDLAVKLGQDIKDFLLVLLLFDIKFMQTFFDALELLLVPVALFLLLLIKHTWTFVLSRVNLLGLHLKTQHLIQRRRFLRNAMFLCEDVIIFMSERTT